MFYNSSEAIEFTDILCDVNREEVRTIFINQQSFER